MIVLKYVKDCFLVFLSPLTLLLKLLIYTLKITWENTVGKICLILVSNGYIKIKGEERRKVKAKESDNTESCKPSTCIASTSNFPQQSIRSVEQIFFPYFLENGKIKLSETHGDCTEFLPNMYLDKSVRQYTATNNECRLGDVDRKIFAWHFDKWMKCLKLPNSFMNTREATISDGPLSLQAEARKQFLKRRTMDNKEYFNDEWNFRVSADTSLKSIECVKNIKREEKFYSFTHSGKCLRGESSTSMREYFNKDGNEKSKIKRPISWPMLNDDLYITSLMTIRKVKNREMDILRDLVSKINKIAAGKDLLSVNNNILVLHEDFEETDAWNNVNSSSDFQFSENSLEKDIAYIYKEGKNKTKKHYVSKICNNRDNTLTAEQTYLNISKMNDMERHEQLTHTDFKNQYLVSLASYNDNLALTNDTVFEDDSAGAILSSEEECEKSDFKEKQNPKETVYFFKSGVSILRDHASQESNVRILKLNRRYVAANYLKSVRKSLKSFRSNTPLISPKASFNCMKAIKSSESKEDLKSSSENWKRVLSDLEEWAEVEQKNESSSDEECQEIMTSYSQLVNVEEIDRTNVDDFKSYSVCRDDAQLLKKSQSRKEDASSSFLEFKRNTESSVRRWIMKSKKPKIKLSLQKLCSKLSR